MARVWWSSASLHPLGWVNAPEQHIVMLTTSGKFFSPDLFTKSLAPRIAPRPCRWETFSRTPMLSPLSCGPRNRSGSPHHPFPQVQCHQRGEDPASPEGAPATEGHQQGQGAEGESTRPERGPPAQQASARGPCEVMGGQEAGTMAGPLGWNQDPPTSTSAPLHVLVPRCMEPQ